MATRKTRIVCISDTHNQTPKLPPGDVLIHAGDLTNQGSYSELKKTITWLEKADFEAKIVIAGNHDTTLDEPFFYSNENKWKWPQPQDPVACRKLLTESTAITYLENEAATVYLTSAEGPRTRFKIFGSPYSPGRRGWAFQYSEDKQAEGIWGNIKNDVDIVVTHTPAYGHCDLAGEERSGCPILLKRLALTRPLLHLCGHIHAGRGAERIQWTQPASLVPTADGTSPGLVNSVNYWEDPGVGSKKLSLINLTAKAGRRLDNIGRTKSTDNPESLQRYFHSHPGISRLPHRPEGEQARSVDIGRVTSFDGDAPCMNEVGVWTRKDGGTMYYQDAPHNERTEGVQDDEGFDQEKQGIRLHNETLMVNAAIMGTRIVGNSKTFNKPIVVDIDLPVWYERCAE